MALPFSLDHVEYVESLGPLEYRVMMKDGRVITVEDDRVEDLWELLERLRWRKRYVPPPKNGR